MRAGISALPAPAQERIRRVLVLVNRRAGGVARQPRLVDELRRAIVGRGDVVATHGPHELHSALRQARAQGVDTIAICGGDGTNTTVLTALSNTWHGPWPRLTLLVGGTVNTAAAGLGMSGRPAERLARLLAAEQPRVRRRPLLKVNDRVGFLFGTSMPARVLDAYYSGPLGPVGCALLAGRIVTSIALRGPLARRLFEPEPVHLEVDGAPHPMRRSLALMAAAVPVVAVGMRATHRAGEDGGFHLVGMDTPPWRHLTDVPRVWLGLKTRSMLSLDTLAHRARLRLPTGGRYTLDGELFDGTDLELSATPPVEMVDLPVE